MDHSMTSTVSESLGAAPASAAGATSLPPTPLLRLLRPLQADDCAEYSGAVDAAISAHRRLRRPSKCCATNVASTPGAALAFGRSFTFVRSFLFTLYFALLLHYCVAVPLSRSARKSDSRGTMSLLDHHPLDRERRVLRVLRKRHIDLDSLLFAPDARRLENKAIDFGEEIKTGQFQDEDYTRHISHDLAIKYLAEFGYLSESKLPTLRELHDAVRAFQDMAGLPATGRLDRVTTALMTQPRCGNSDVSRLRERRKRFVYISQWENRVKENELRLTWFIENYTDDIPRAEIRSTVRKAFELWSSQVKLDRLESLSLVFEEAATAEAADITILWAEGDHGDAHKFDGPGQDGSNILAHTFYPNYQSRGTLNGDIHLDDYERWHVNGSRDGASFPHVLVHEIGHTLGLGHSKKQQALMYPIYRKEQLELIQLDIDDKCAINWSYIGATHYCLYIFLVSEILPKRIAVEKDITYMIDDDNNDVWETEEKARRTHGKTPLHVTEVFERKLRQARIPLCKDDNTVQSHLENMLVQRLSFPRQLAEEYSDTVCRFLSGLHAQYGMPITNNFHEVFRIHGAHNYFQNGEKFRALEENGLKDREFDKQFFEWLTGEFVR